MSDDQQTNTILSREILSVLEEELNRIVLDVHDGPVQNLFAVLSLLTQAQHELQTDEPDLEVLSNQLQQISSIVEASLHEIKFFLGTFRSPGFRDRSLRKLIRSLIMQHEGWTDQVVELELADNIPDQVNLPIKIALYRIVQEALSNGHRHSGTDYQYVRLWMEEQYLCLLVRDDGKGFDPPDLQVNTDLESESHIGLRGMHERVKLVGGEFELVSELGKGTTLRIKVPIL